MKDRTAEVEEGIAALPELDPLEGDCEMCYSSGSAYIVAFGQKLCRACFYAVSQFDLATENTQVCCICGTVLGEVGPEEPTIAAGCANCSS